MPVCREITKSITLSGSIRLNARKMRAWAGAAYRIRGRFAVKAFSISRAMSSGRPAILRILSVPRLNVAKNPEYGLSFSTTGRETSVETCRNSVRMNPGSITTTFTPKGASSPRMPSDSASSACLVESYTDESGLAIRPATELMLMIRPPPCFRIIGITIWLKPISENTFVSKLRLMSSRGTISMGPRTP
jgi:hypothetical protein